MRADVEACSEKEARLLIETGICEGVKAGVGLAIARRRWAWEAHVRLTPVVGRN